MMAANYRHIGDRENRLGRHYSRFSPFWPTPALSGQSLALRKLCDAGSNRRSQVRIASIEDVPDQADDPADALPEFSTQPPISKIADLWMLGRHRLLCGSAL